MTNLRSETAMATTRAAPPLANGLQPLSCLRCAQRKVRCDRVVPCSNCIKHESICEFPQPRTERRKRRRVQTAAPSTASNETPTRDFNQVGHDLISARRDDVVATIEVAHESVGNETSGPSPPGRGTFRVAPRLNYPNQVHVAGGNKHAYPEEHPWARASHKTGASLFTAESSPIADAAVVLAPNCDGFALSLTTVTPSIEVCYPSIDQFQYLWQAYQRDVHPVTMITHAPSTGEMLAEIVRSQRRTTSDKEALLFAIASCALITMSNEDCVVHLREKKSNLLWVFRRACEAALTSADFLSSSSITVLQSYSIYLVSLSPYEDACKLWNLTGIAERNARRLGLHQNESNGLSPFENETRRRLWSQIAMQDAFLSARATSWDQFTSGSDLPIKIATVNKPPNINETDISPDMKDAVVERSGATDMIFCILRYKLLRFTENVNHFSKTSSTRTMLDPTLDCACTSRESANAVDQVCRAERTRREHEIGRIEEDLELGLLRYCDPLKPVHVLTVIMARLALCKLRFTMLRLNLLQHDRSASSSVDSPEVSADADQDHRGMFLAALKVLEYHNSAQQQPMLKGFLWHIQQHFEWRYLEHVLKNVNTPHSATENNNAWDQIRIFYESRSNLYNGHGDGSQSVSQRAIDRLAIDAWRTQQKMASEQGKALRPSPSYIRILEEREDSDASNASSTIVSPEETPTRPTSDVYPITKGSASVPPSGSGSPPNWAGYNTSSAAGVCPGSHTLDDLQFWDYALNHLGLGHAVVPGTANFIDGLDPYVEFN